LGDGMSEKCAELTSDRKSVLSEEQYQAVVALLSDNRTRRAIRKFERLSRSSDRPASVLEGMLELDFVQSQHVQETQSALLHHWEELYAAVREDEVSVADAVYTRIQLH
jgi:hypothetical protein